MKNISKEVEQIKADLCKKGYNPISPIKDVMASELKEPDSCSKGSTKGCACGCLGT